MSANREQWLAKVFVELLTSLCEHCVELLGATEVGIVLVDEHQQLRAMASSTEQLHVLELIEVQNQEGPCLDAFRTGAPVLNAPIDVERWPQFAALALTAGYRTVHAIPMRHSEQIIGAVNIFDRADRQLTADDADLAQALAGVATIAILQHRALRRALNLADQLQQALHSRVAVEQAKGVLAERLHIDIADAFTAMRGYARNRNEQIGTVAQRVIDGSLPADELLTDARKRRGRTRRAT